MTAGPGGAIVHDGASQPFAITWTNSNAYGVLNLAGGALSTTTKAVQFGGANGTGQTGLLNLASGTFSTGVAVGNAAATSGSGNNYYINLAGATIKTTAGVTGLFPATNTYGTVVTTAFGPVDNSTLSGGPAAFGGGVTINTNGFNSTITTPIVQAAGSGVAQSSLSVTSGGSGYVGAPMVQFTGGTLTAGGTPAAGYALISDGQVTGIVITSPGTYSVAPSVTLTGGGGTGASISVGTLIANAAGGIIKNGAGSLTLSGISSYAGDTTLNAGTLSAGVATFAFGGSGGTPGKLIINGGTLDASLTATITNPITFGADLTFAGTAALTQNTGAITLGASRTITVTANTLTLNGGVSGDGFNLTKAGAGTLVLGGVLGTTTGGVTVNAGKLTLSGVNTYTGATTLAADALGRLRDLRLRWQRRYVRDLGS